MENVVSMEEVRSKKLVRKEAGQPSGGHDQLIEENEKLSIVIHETVRPTPSSSIEQKFKILKEAAEDKAGDQSQSSKPHIQRVPFILRDKQNFQKYYEPRAVSIGPLHHGNPKLKLAENLKLKLAGLFIKQHELVEEVLYAEIKNNLKNLKECYDEEEIKNYNDEDLAWMLFVDGCAVLHFIECAVAEDHGKKLKNLNLKTDHIAFAKLDLFLLENQLPYQVLKLLMESKDHSKKLIRESINKFIDDNIMRPQENREQQEQEVDDPTHLLDLLRKRLLHKPSSEVPSFIESLLQKCKICKITHNLDIVKEHKDEHSEVHSSFIERQLQKFKKYISNRKGKTTHNGHSFRNVKELTAAGIWFKASNTSFLSDISFVDMILFATLKLPHLIVDDSTAPKFLNLIAYEMCPDFVNDFGVTSYVYFLDSLIDQAEDVKELRNARILHNALGSDEEVSILFNQISNDLVPNPDTYEKLKDHIQNHCDNKWKTGIALFYHNHFSTPWTALAFFGALIALGLSFIQAWDPIYKFIHHESFNSTS